MRVSFHAMIPGSGLTAVAVLGALAVAGFASGCGGRYALSIPHARDAGQGAGGQAQGFGGNSQSGVAVSTGGSVGTGGSPDTGGSSGMGGASGAVVTCTFSGLLVDQESLSSYSESGVTVLATAGGWQARTGFGNPSPSVLLYGSAGGTATGQVRVTAGGSAFRFSSVDLYSSTTPIPYVFTGLTGSTEVFSVSGTVPNTFGNFATVANPSAGDLIDTLVIELSNGMGQNPMGLDNVRLIE
jgi:hypothetical protein